MKPNLADYRGLKICVAVSGGRDSMALLNYLYEHGGEYGIVLSALNCDHMLRGEKSARESRFVKEWCEERGIPVTCFKTDCAQLAEKSGKSVETAARDWRLECYSTVDADAVATAHHLDDNAETVLFYIARGSALAGASGITDTIFSDGTRIIRPLIECSRKEIDEYITEKNIPYADDESNFCDGYTRNKIRLNVLPELEKAVPGAMSAIYRFSRLAAQDDEYLRRVADGLIARDFSAYTIEHCEERVIFSRAAVEIIKEKFSRKDYTKLVIDSLFSLQSARDGAKYEFSGLVAFKERDKIAICEKREPDYKISYGTGKFELGALTLEIGASGNGLRFDADKVPREAVIRPRKTGDKFCKFGGGTKSLGDFLTDRKVPQRLRGVLPVIAVENEVLAVCGVEISENIKVTADSKNILFINIY